MPTSAPTPVAFREIASPVGTLLLAASADGLCVLEFENSRHPIQRTAGWQPAGDAPHPVLDATQTQLAEYFARQRQVFDLPLAPEGTPFQQSVWRALCRIPYGQTCHYGDIARQIGQPTAVRAVGAANGRNPVAIVIPCHRVIGANGSLVGFGGGLPVKRTLLTLECPQTSWLD
jgi:methylated-DNA-[protein]-cysteine S-methyltransferase